MAGAVYFGGFVVLALAGIPLQDRKLRARYGDIYAAYLTATSAVPFTMGRGSFAGNSGRPGPALLIPLAGAALFGALHWVWTLGHGAPFAMPAVLGGLYAVARQISRGSRAVDKPAVR